MTPHPETLARLTAQAEASAAAVRKARADLEQTRAAYALARLALAEARSAERNARASRLALLRACNPAA